ncbi:class I SAM-dependent methyltransferase [Roseisolibacter sp. H3M3-2]|uniref:class I SAM-dependent DNA methyltransferase n=1 Tax=Roseisolibacter sp. H3M3-2 TaxID=3031323 RepID=UPI0023DA7066|nr:class I SAM-dependent methyltransferase [Roseisolibacter sp. H3M3-2]MDF1502759.1 class I SAM-dependent methyltransferase [Roseisolibacter sp. H3M3-2]
MSAAGGERKAYDRAYFDRWYRSPRHRVRSPAEVARLVAFVLATADHLLGRPARTVLDVGAGEGNWQPVLRRLRPAIAYTGVDRSEYAVRRFGKRRHLLLGDATALDALPLRGEYDLVIASGVLNYLTRPELRAALGQLAARAGGMLYLELFTAADDLKGDTRFAARASADWLRRELRRAGLVGGGLHCYVRREEQWRLAEMERTV